MKAKVKSILSVEPQVKSILYALLFNRFAHALVSVFIPYIIISQGGTLIEVARFYLTYAVIKLVVNYPAMKCIQRYSASMGLFCGFISGAFELIWISAYTHSPHPLYITLAAISLSFANGFGFNAQHLYLSRTLIESTRGKNLANIDIAGGILSFAAPAIGASIGIICGNTTLLLVAVGVILLTLVPLRKMREYERAHPMHSEKLRYSLQGAPLRDVVANYCFNIETVVGIMVWPVFLALYAGSYRLIGSIATLGLIASLVVVRHAGQRGDRGGNRSTLSQGSILSSFAHLLRLFATTTSIIGAVTIFYQCSSGYMCNAWSSLYYKHAAHRGVQYIISMEIACDLAYLSVWLAFYLLSTVGLHSQAFTLSFIGAAIAVHGVRLISQAKGSATN